MKSIITTLLSFLVFSLSAQINSSAQWTWVSGNNTTNVAGVYGARGVAAATNKPGTRHGCATWTDANGNLWLFGGRGNDAYSPTTSLLLLNDLWKYNPTTNQWTWMSGDSTGEQHGVYGVMGTADSSTKPGSRSVGATWTDTNGNFWLFGGTGYAATGNVGSLALNDLWKYNPTTNQWTWVNGDSTTEQPGMYGQAGVTLPTNKPGARYAGATWADTVGNFWLFGGQTLSTTYGDLSDLWKYNYATNLWTWVKGDSSRLQPGVYGVKGIESSSNKPGARIGCYTWTDAAGNFWLFGGSGYATSSGGNLNDLWKYNIASNQWVWVNGDSVVNQRASYGAIGLAATMNKPGARYYGSKWADDAGNLWLFGGIGFVPPATSGRFSDFWKYNIANNQWTWMRGDTLPNQPGVYGTIGVAAATNKPGARTISASWKDAFGNFWMFGGNNPNRLNDLWKFGNTNPRFASIAGGNWNVPSTWAGGIVPTTNAVVTIRHAVIVQTNTTCYSLKLDGPSANLTVKAGVQLVVNN